MATAARERASFVEFSQLPLAASAQELEIWLGPDMVAEPPIYGANGDRQLPSVAFSSTVLELYEASGVLQTQMFESTVVSPVTGCWLPSPNRYIAHGGYVPARDKKAEVSPSGSTSRHRAVRQRINRLLGLQDLTPEDTWEHFCRTPGCSNPHHGELMSIEQNNERKNKAKTLEDKLLANQPAWTLAGLEWLEPHVSEAGEGLVDIVISTRYGAYLLEVDHGAILGHHLPDPAREAMREPAPYPRKKEKLEVHTRQMSLDSNEMYADLLRRAVARRKRATFDLVAA